MFTDKLFDHKYDIDDIIVAFCGDDKQGKWVLDSRNNVVVCAEDESSPYFNAKEGDDNNHIHIIEPLPMVFVNEIKTHEKFRKLDENVQAEVLDILSKIHKISDLKAYFKQGFAGGFIRECIKQACLEWLDMHGMIPPSMSHVRDIESLANTPNLKDIKVKITLDN